MILVVNRNCSMKIAIRLIKYFSEGKYFTLIAWAQDAEEMFQTRMVLSAEAVTAISWQIQKGY